MNQYRPFRYLAILSTTMLLGACMQDPGDQQRVFAGAAVGALVGYAATGDASGAVQGAVAGGAIGYSFGQRHGVSTSDCQYRFRGNSGAIAACQRGVASRERSRQRELERNAYRYGKQDYM